MSRTVSNDSVLFNIEKASYRMGTLPAIQTLCICMQSSNSTPTCKSNSTSVVWSRGACKYYITTLGVGGGSEGNDYFAYVVRGGLEAKCLHCLCNGSKFLLT